MELSPIAVIRSPFREKFGIPRQSRLVPALTGEIVFLPEYSQPEALRGIEAFSHLWLIWGFSEAKKLPGKGWSATVRPPRLGGNIRKGVFATRSPFRPNPLGLSAVKLEQVFAEESPMRLTVSGIDLLDGTPIYDIKPYIPFADAIPDAAGGYTEQTITHSLQVIFPDALRAKLPTPLHETVCALLAQDPRPGYLDDPAREYGMQYGAYDIRFRVNGELLTVTEIRTAQS
ncbi:MAG: tRNA (N6-threonylcarbamoyladenosine(37)-N6)-methyltransferase TrmO [Oscillospiraceae bacterium]|nr:tRNA (N6-threonylcarbamoyladenosine(37)-N6)-methyltransferase TrmO [Oscillospiraceae bacterium]